MITKKIYFISDAHLGTPDQKSSLAREKSLVALLDQIQKDALAIYFLGDIFDFWYEYKRVVPRGFTRLLGKIASLSDAGLEIHFFTGNHDIWVKDYLPDETGVIIHRHALITNLLGKTFYLAHGDGLDESDRKFRMLKKIFTSSFLQWCFSRIHPNFAIALASKWSKHSRDIHGADPFRGEDEAIVKYARKYLSTQGLDFMVFGHRHTPVIYPFSDQSKLIMLGDWLSNFTYGIFDGTDFQLKKY
ncbi:MAG: UDP-2,3-diacylglucosamine diphosphatase [Bacteroidales bacterium]|nr:UDP-2,3-diacylglucosamine diphosphatase [Bacteroidales bacterium]